ncbi:MAG: cytochrome c biogenesis protein CcsA [Burkholderiaceae bacterium]
MILSSALVHAFAWAAVAAYALSVLGRPVWGARAQVLALVLHALLLAATFVGEADAGQGIRWGFAPVLSLTAWLVLTVHFTETRLVPISGLRRIFALIGAASVLLALAFPGDVVIVTYSIYAPLHWTLGIAAYALFGVAVVHAAMLDAAERQMRQKAGAGLLGMPLLSLERLTFLFVEAGFVVLSLAILIGLFTMAHWRWGDHKTVLSLASWATFAALIIGRRTRGWRGRQATRWVYAGAVLMLLAYAGSRFVFEVVLQRAPTGLGN